MRQVTLFVHVPAADLADVHPNFFGNVFHERLAHEHALRAAKPSECRVCHRVGHGQIALDTHIGHLVSVDAMKQRAIHDALTEVC